MDKIDIEKLDRRLIEKHLKEGQLNNEQLAFLGLLPDESSLVEESEIDRNYLEEIDSVSRQEKPWLERL